MEVLLGIFVFVFGLCLGSFLNCVVFRLEREEKITGRSRCPKCGKQLGWRDLFPVFSFLFLGGRCRYCKSKISIQYPLVELATGFLFILILSFKNIGLPAGSPISFLSLAFLFYIASALIVIFIYDLKHYIIPDRVLFPAIIITFLFQIFNSGLWIFNSLFAALIASGFFFIIFLVSGGKWMGFGDVKLAVLMGLLLGLPDVLTALFLSFFFGAIIGAILIVWGKKKLKSEVPFGPFLIAGTFIALFWGAQIIQWYSDLLA